MQSTHPTGTHRVCYQCDNPARSGSMFCPECLPERFPPIVQEKPPKPPRRSLWQAVAGVLRLRSHTRNLTERINDMELELLDTQQANALLRKRCERVKDELKQLAQAYDEVESERSKLARKVTSIAIDWAPVTEIALKHLGSSAEMPAIAAWVADRLSPPSADQNAVVAISCDYNQSPAPLGQNPETEIAPGHNPKGLTAAEVGVGFRLLTVNEIQTKAFSKTHCECWVETLQAWLPDFLGNSLDNTYRVRI